MLVAFDCSKELTPTISNQQFHPSGDNGNMAALYVPECKDVALYCLSSKSTLKK